MTNLPNPNPDFRIDSPGEYVTRSGVMVKIKSKIEGDSNYHWIGECEGGQIDTWRKDGKYDHAIRNESASDIIAKAPIAAGEGLSSPIVPGWYKMQNGEKARVAWVPDEKYPGNTILGFSAPDTATCWGLDGKSHVRDFSLVAPWQEPVVVDRWIPVDEFLQFAHKQKPDNGKQYIHIRITDGVAEIIPENGDE